MSEEELKKTIDIVAGIEVSCETEAIAKEELMSYVEQLQQENIELKDTILNYQLHTEVAPNSHESINGNELICNLFTENKKLKEQNESLKKYYEYDNKSWKNLAIKQAHELEIKNNILTEFEKWLKERYKQQTETLNKMEEDNIERPYVKSRRYLVEECLEKLQELKEERNETNNNI